MDNHTFKTVTFGGFDKQDVAAYIEKISREYTARIEELERDKAILQDECETLRSQNEFLRSQVAEQSEQLTKVEQELTTASAEAQTLAEAQARAEDLTAQVAQLQPDALAYRQFRDRIGDIECEARSRAAELENTTRSRLRQTAAEFRAQYMNLSATFEAAAEHVNAELRKVEVNMTQLPRSLDQIGAELQSLESVLSDN